MANSISTWWAALLDPAKAGLLVIEPPAGFTLRLTLGVAALYAFYGTSMGAFRGPAWALASGIKLPLLYLLTITACLLPLYGINCTLGPRLRLDQCVRLLLLATSANAIALASYVPFSYFFALTSGDSAYDAIVLTNVGVFALSGIISVVVIAMVFRGAGTALRRPLAPSFLIAWAILYAFVGTQMSWVLRPWIGSPEAGVVFLRPISGSFPESVWGLCRSVFFQGG